MTDVLACVALRPAEAEDVLGYLDEMCMMGKEVSDETMAELEGLADQQEERKEKRWQKEKEILRGGWKGRRRREKWGGRPLNGAEMDPRILLNYVMKHPERVEL